jgi:DNA-binding CsgD family transcriptional regulator
LTTDPLRTLHNLSDLEFKVLHLIASGKDLAQIAREMHLSEVGLMKASAHFSDYQ